MHDRREFLRVLLAGATGSSALCPVAGQAPGANVQITKLTDRTIVLSENSAAIGNVAVLLANEGLMMIDGGAAEYAAELHKVIAENVDSRAVRLLFNTHWHWDHVGSNELLGATVTTIVAHENVKKRLSTRVFAEMWNKTIEPLKPSGLPGGTFADTLKIAFGGEKIDCVHVPLAHTDGDAYVFLGDSNILLTGDLFFNKSYPTIDYTTGGWIGGMTSALDSMLKLADDKTRIVPGHGPIASRDDMIASRNMLELVHKRLDGYYRQGRSVDEVIAARPTRDLDARWGKATDSGMFLSMAYTSMIRHGRKP